MSIEQDWYEPPREPRPWSRRRERVGDVLRVAVLTLLAMLCALATVWCAATGHGWLGTALSAASLFFGVCGYAVLLDIDERDAMRTPTTKHE
jgi:hypothetical protein